ncbi:MAG: transcription elongation factor GreA [Deltaproteobacteria bacterium]|nr:transcription elongation factor GreA [Deltaproteobacteria bacterium]
MTPAGQQRLRDELRQLKDEERPKIAREIGAAREHGDLSENAEYHAAKDRQGMVEARIEYLENVLGRAQVIDPSTLAGDKVKFGAKVSVLNLETEEENVYQIVGPEEADLGRGQISVSSPLARGLLGHEVGDEVTVRLPAGVRSFEVVRISFE